MKRVAVLLLIAGCGQTQSVSATDADGCTLCHGNISVAHTKAVVLCTSCHGQGPNLDAVKSRASSRDFPSQGSSDYQQLLDSAHVRPRDPTRWLAAGLSGTVGACFNGAVDPTCQQQQSGIDPKKGLGTVDDAIDSEYSRDLNYLRFINPGDLRVAHASCGGGNPQQGDYGGCHAEEVFRVRRSIMTGNSSVVTAAFLGNRGQASPLLQGETIDPRGYMFDLDAVDACFHSDTNQYDHPCRGKYPADDPISALLPGNEAGSFDVFPGTIKADSTQVPSGTTMTHAGASPRLAGIGGQMLDGTSQPHDHLSAPDNANFSSLADPTLLGSCIAPIPPVEPVDAILRGFRAYYPLWLPGTGHNFDAVAGNTLNPASTGITKQVAHNPNGRGHASGCTGCHMLYANDGHSEERGDPAITNSGRQLDPSSPDGIDVSQDNGSHKQQRFYPTRHRLTSRIPTRQCGLCHTFVTRIDLAYQGVAEVEEKSTLARSRDLDATKFPGAGDITFSLPDGTTARMLDAQVTVAKQGGSNQLVIDSRMQNLNDRLQQVCAQDPTLDCENRAVYSNDLNGDGVLDQREHALFDDITGGELWMPDRIPRSASVDGRQARILYGGPNGTAHLKDVHLQKGMHCIDCHFYQDVHGDGNIYTDNWEQIEIECEDCHGFAKQRAWVDDAAPHLITSGPNGGNDLFAQKDEFGRSYFELRDGSDGKKHLFQRSRITLQDIGEVDQIADQGGGGDPNNPHSDKHIAVAPKDAGKLECYSCHNTFAMNCLACHYQQNFNQQSRQQEEVFLTGGVQSSHTNFQLFGLVRGPLILAQNGNAEQHRLAPFRSTMEAFVSVTNCAGDTIAGNVVHSNCRHNVNGVPTPIAGVSMNNFMPHSVPPTTMPSMVRGCETCHPATKNGDVVNNHILAQTMGLGTGRLNLLGDWLYVASSGSAGASALDVVDIKDEGELTQGLVDASNLPITDTSGKNSFPGFVVGNTSSSDPRAPASVRSVGVPSGGTPQDIVLVRGWNGSLCTKEQPLNPDLAVVAAGNGLALWNVSLPDVRGATILMSIGSFPVAVDHLGPDISDPIFYVADSVAGFETLDLTGLNFDPAGAKTPTMPADKTLHKTSGWPAGVGAFGVKRMGTVAAVGAGTAGLILVDASMPKAPSVIGAPLPLCLPNEASPCARSGGRVISQGTVVYVATNAGVVAVDVGDPTHPKVLSVPKGTTAMPSEDLAISGHLLFVAAGASGLQVLDVTDPAQPKPVKLPPLRENGSSASITEAHGVVVGAVPTQTWVFVADGASGLRALNVSFLFDPYQQPRNPLTLEARDPFSPRDTTVDGSVTPVISFATRGPPRRIARGVMLDRLVDESGRALRDAWNPGSGAMSAQLMHQLRQTVVPLQ